MVAVDPGADDHKKVTYSCDARVQYNIWMELPDSNRDYVPVVRGARGFLFNYSIGNFEGAFCDFASPSCGRLFFSVRLASLADVVLRLVSPHDSNPSKKRKAARLSGPPKRCRTEVLSARYQKE